MIGQGKASLLTASAFAFLALAAPASAAPVLDVSSSHRPASNEVPAGSHAIYKLSISNTGTGATTGNVTVNFSVPAGLEVTDVSFEQPFGIAAWTCSMPDSQSASCEGPEIAESALALPIGPGEVACEAELGSPCRVIVTLKAGANTPPGTFHPTIEACGGGAASCVSIDDPLEVVPLDFHIADFDGHLQQQNGDPATQAASHPYAAKIEFRLSTAVTADGVELATDDFKDSVASLAAGMVLNPRAIPSCTQAEAVSGACPPESQIGLSEFSIELGGPGLVEIPLYNMQVPNGTPALFGSVIAGVVVTYQSVKLRTGRDYGFDVIARNTPESFPILGGSIALWGVPADPGHDVDRFLPSGGKGASSSAPPMPLISLPTSCTGPVDTSIDVTGWLGGEASASFLSHDNTEPVPNPVGFDGCNAVDFSPALEARPTTSVADAPSGLDVDFHIPQREACDPGLPISCETAEAHLRDATVILPPGLVVNPSAANGLGACSEAQFGFTGIEGGLVHTTPDPATCPDDSKLGTVQIGTPILDHPMKGSVYIAAPHANPFNSLLALYLAIDDPQTGVVVKLAGEVHANPATGRLSVTFTENPQLPFEDLELHLFGGAGGSLRTPATCGSYSTTSSLTPWTAPDSGPPATPSDTWAISQAPAGGTCPTQAGSRPNAPNLDAGSVSPIAVDHTPMVINLRREDGSQEFSAASLTLAPGMADRLAGVPYCADPALAAAAARPGRAERASPSCPAASRIGTVDVAAGAGPAPYNVQGAAYLTGPYKGAPLSMAIVTPAAAGPFDLGTVVVRVALYFDPDSGQITAVSDTIPSILQGIPLDLRSVQVRLDRPDFARNGTSCDPLSFSGQLLSTLGQAVPLSERFQLAECGRLAFKPKLAMRLRGDTKRGGHPALTGILQVPEGGANLASASIALPRSELLDQAHIGTVCASAQFAAGECPAASVHGQATATSPLVDYALEGPVYLRSSGHKLPDLVMALHGPAPQPIEVDAVARIDSVKGVMRTTFEGMPDLPLAKVVLSMEGGKKGLLRNSTNVCGGAHRATVELDGQNGKVSDLRLSLENDKCGKRRHRKHTRRAALPARG